jgi:AcrR family transcriptional regulator
MRAIETTISKTTGERVLDAAESLFARQGIRGTSLKEITELAEVNIAAVNYHFRSKEALVKAVYERSFVPLNEDRLRMLEAAEAEAGDGDLSIETVLHALFEPMIRAWIANRNFILLIGRLQNEPDSEISGYVQTLYGTLIPRFLDATKRALPGTPETVLFFWVHFLFGGVVYTLLNSQDMQRLHEGQYLLDTPALFLERLTQFGAAGLRAQVPPKPSKTNPPATNGSGQCVPKSKNSKKRSHSRKEVL